MSRYEWPLYCAYFVQFLNDFLRWFSGSERVSDVCAFLNVVSVKFKELFM